MSPINLNINTQPIPNTKLEIGIIGQDCDIWKFVPKFSGLRPQKRSVLVIYRRTVFYGVRSRPAHSRPTVGSFFAQLYTLLDLGVDWW